jgi:pSer/pThr/pTyr-binding forkhead associated (FHA) protein
MMSPSGADLFLASCGAGGALRLLVTDHDSGLAREHLSGQPFLLAGRHQRNGLSLAHPDVSRRHAYFQLIEGRLACIDLGSRAGITWPDGARSSGWMPPSGVRIGPWTLCPVGALPADAMTGETGGPDWRPLEDRIERPGWPLVTIEVTGGEQPKPVRCRLRRAITLVGTTPICKIRLGHPSVSRFHCSLVWTSLGAWIVDLFGLDGTHLNGQPVSSARVAHGDEVRVGAYRLRFRYSGKGPDLAFPAKLAAETGLAGQGGLAALPALAMPPVSATGPEAHLLVPVIQQFNLMQQQISEQFQQTTLMMFRMFTNMHKEQATLIREEMHQIQRVTGELQALQQKLRNEAPASPDTACGPVAQGTPGPTFPAQRSPASRASPPDDRPIPPPLAEMPGAVPGDVDAWLTQRIEELQTERQTRWHRVLSFLGRQ